MRSAAGGADDAMASVSARRRPTAALPATVDRRKKLNVPALLSHSAKAAGRLQQTPSLADPSLE